MPCKQLLFVYLVDKQTIREGVLLAVDYEKWVVNLGKRLEPVKVDEELNKGPVHNGSYMGCILDKGEVYRCEGKRGNKRKKSMTTHQDQNGNMNTYP
jgi:hypothetical protein